MTRRLRSIQGPSVLTLTQSEIRSQCLSSFAYFVAFFQGAEWFDPTHRILCDWVQSHIEPQLQLAIAGKDGECEDVLLTETMPRGSLKSTILSKFLPVWLYLRWNEIRCLIAGNTEPNAALKLKGIMALLKSQRFLAIFPEAAPAPGARFSTKCIELPRKGDYDEGTFEAAGVGTRLIGRHYSFIGEDDTTAPDDSDMTMGVTLPDRETIQRAIGFHQNTVPLLVPKGLRINQIVSTRWGKRDLLYHIWTHEPGYKRFDAPAIRGAGVSNWREGTPVFTKFYDMRKLEAIYSRTSANMFACLYLNKPQDIDLQTFHPEWWSEDLWLPLSAVDRTGSVSIALDPAISENEDACDSALTAVRHWHDPSGARRWDWLEAAAGRWDEQVTIERLCAMVDHYRNLGFSVTDIVIETVAFQRIYKNLYWNHLIDSNKADQAVPITDFPQMRTNKRKRIAGILVPWLKQRRVRFIKGLDPRVVEQLEDFSPNSNECLVDLIDSFSMHSRVAPDSKHQALPQRETPGPNSLDAVITELTRKRTPYRAAGTQDLLPCPIPLNSTASRISSVVSRHLSGDYRSWNPVKVEKPF